MSPIQKKASDLIPGIHAVEEALEQKRIEIRELWVAAGKSSPRVARLVKMAQDQGVPVAYKPSSSLSQLLPDTAHQGVVALAESYRYFTLEQVVQKASWRSGSALLVAVDHVTDEGNLGAIIRTAAFFGAEGLIIPKDRSAGLSARVLKRSSGGYLHLPTARVVNMARALDLLKRQGAWIVGTAGEAPESVYRFDWRRNLALVLGSEEKGLSRPVRKQCDQLVGIPRAGRIESLNVAVATGVVLSEIVRARGRL